MFRTSILALLLAASSANAQGVDNRASHQAGGQHTQPKPKPNIQPSLPVAVQDDIQRIARALEAANHKRATTEEKNEAERNLADQDAIAYWGRFLVLVGFIEALLTGIGVFLVYRTLVHTRTAANAAQGAVTEAKEATKVANAAKLQSERQSKKELRAYLSIEPMGINQMVASTSAIGHVAVRNVGKIPAKAVSVIVNMRSSGARDTDFAVPPDREDVHRVIQPGASMRQGSENYLPIHDEVINPGKNIFVFGVVYYDDGFAERRFTHFCHRYATASHDPDWNRGIGKPIIAVEKARYHTHGNEAD